MSDYFPHSGAGCGIGLGFGYGTGKRNCAFLHDVRSASEKQPTALIPRVRGSTTIMHKTVHNGSDDSNLLRCSKIDHRTVLNNSSRTGKGHGWDRRGKHSNLANPKPSRLRKSWRELPRG